MANLTAAVLDTVQKLYIDANNPVLQFSIITSETAWDACTYKLKALYSGSALFEYEFEGITASYTYTVPAATAQSILTTKMPSAKQITVTYELTTYDNETGYPVGNASTKSGIIGTKAATSAPVLDPETVNYITWQENNATLEQLLSGDAVVQGKSILGVSVTGILPRNGASIVSVDISFGSLTNTASWNTSGATPYAATDFNPIADSGELPIKYIATDSRGYILAGQSSAILSLPYSNIMFDSYSAARNPLDPTELTLNITGHYSPLEIENYDYNYLRTFEYRLGVVVLPWVQPTWEQNWHTLTPTSSTGTSFTFSGALSSTIDESKTYDIEIRAYDALTTPADTIIRIPKATPKVSFYNGNIGVDIDKPQRPLDVTGAIGMNGFNVLGLVEVMHSTSANPVDFDDLTTQGLYAVDGTDFINAPSGYRNSEVINGFVLVLDTSSASVWQIAFLNEPASSGSGDTIRGNIYERRLNNPSQYSDTWHKLLTN